jgi:hypothetical protein
MYGKTINSRCHSQRLFVPLLRNISRCYKYLHIPKEIIIKEKADWHPAYSQTSTFSDCLTSFTKTKQLGKFVSIMTRLQNEQEDNRGSSPGSRRYFISTAPRPSTLSSSQRLLGVAAGVKSADAWSWSAISTVWKSRLRVKLDPYTPSRREV